MMVYDITNRNSFDGIQVWKQELDKLDEEDTVLMLIGNKCDLQSLRQVSIEEGKQQLKYGGHNTKIKSLQLAAEFGIWFMETSTLEDVNVEQAFVCLTQDIKQKVEAKPPFVKDNGRSCCVI